MGIFQHSETLNARGNPVYTDFPSPDGGNGLMCYRKKPRYDKKGRLRKPCPEGWHHHGPYLPVGQLGDEWFWKEPKE